ncbi:MAG TPA: DUF4190 domain-containing protein [Polyangiaceae bacterium]|jgi:hypothetical protein
MQPMPGPPYPGPGPLPPAGPFPPHPGPAWPHAGPQATTDAKAVVSLILGILSLLATFCWLGAPLGIPAIIFGVLAHRDIRRSEGLAGGNGLATTGIALGSIGTLLFVGWMGFLAYTAFAPSKTAPMATAVPPSLPPTTAATSTATVPPGGWGAIHVVDLHPSPAGFRTQLAAEVASSRAAGETVLVETTARACTACGEIARAMRDPALQTVLAKVRLVRVDAIEFSHELPSTGMNEAALPWFYVLDARGETRDAISADEWDDNDAEEIAPVLELFLEGKLTARKRPWRGTTL